MGSMIPLASSILHDLRADLLHDLLDLGDVRIERHVERDLVDHPVAAEVLDRTEIAERCTVNSGPRWWRSRIERNEKPSTVPRKLPLTMYSPTRKASSIR